MYHPRIVAKLMEQDKRLIGGAICPYEHDRTLPVLKLRTLALRVGRGGGKSI